MTIAVRVVTPARCDVVEIAKYLLVRDPRLAARFWRAVKTTLDRLGKSPDLGELWGSPDERHAGLRVWGIRGFQHYLVFHRYANGEVAVLRILHSSQDATEYFGSPDQGDQS